MSLTTLLLTLVVGIFIGAAALWPFRSRRWRSTETPTWEIDPTLFEGHRPPDAHALAIQLLGLIRQSIDVQGVALLRKKSEGWKVQATSPGVPFTTSAAIPFKQGLVGLAGEGEREILAESVQVESLIYLAPQPGPVSLALIPTQHRGETVAVLACHGAEGRAFSDSEVALLKRCSRIVMGWEAMATHVARLEISRRQEERVARGVDAMTHESDPEEISFLLLDSLFDVLPALYGFVLISHTASQYFGAVTKRFDAPDKFELGKDTWAHWVIHRTKEPLYLEGTVGQETAMPILWEGEPFPQDRVVLLNPLATTGSRFGVVGIVGRAEDPFSEEDRETAGILLNQASALLDLSLLNLKQQKLAMIDPLTGLYNRRHFDETLANELERAQRQEVSCGLILLDVDHFKNLNDTHGHEAGDRALRALSGRVSRSVRKIDRVCRFGGEEIAVILPDCDQKEAIHVAERVRQAVAEREFVVDTDVAVPITVSLGVSAYPAPTVTMSGILKSADTALYRAKQKGRNRVELARK